MPKHMLQVNQPMFETQLDRMVSQKVNEIRGPDAGRFRPTGSRVPPDMSVPVAGRRIGPVITGEIRPSRPGE
jgi:hypothetical protein